MSAVADWLFLPWVALSPVALLGLLLLARWTVGREWRVPWAIVTGATRGWCLVFGHDSVQLADRTWCARCGRQKREGT